MKYRVTISQLIEAQNPRHAAHIMEGRIATLDHDDRPGVYLVEEYSADWPKTFRLDLRVPKDVERIG